MRKVLLIIAVLVIMTFTATLALAQSTEKAPVGKTTPTEKAPVGKTTSTEKAPGGKTSPPAGDTTPPKVTIAIPADSATYDQNDPLRANYECKDGDGSVLPKETCVGPVGNGEPLDMSPGYHNFTVRATGNNGRQTSVSHGYTVEDAKTEITITIPADGATYDQNDALIADFGCKDGDGTVLPKERCDGPVEDGEPLDMSPGYHSFRVQAVDNDGRRTSTTHGYTVEDSPGTDENDSEDGAKDSQDSGGNGPGGGSGSRGGGDSNNVFIGNIGDTATTVVGSIGDVPSGVAGGVNDTVENLKQGRLPETGGGLTVLLFSGGALISGGWLLVRRFR